MVIDQRFDGMRILSAALFRHIRLMQQHYRTASTGKIMTKVKHQSKLAKGAPLSSSSWTNRTICKINLMRGTLHDSFTRCNTQRSNSTAINLGCFSAKPTKGNSRDLLSFNARTVGFFSFPVKSAGHTTKALDDIARAFNSAFFFHSCAE